MELEYNNINKTSIIDIYNNIYYDIINSNNFINKSINIKT